MARPTVTDLLAWIKLQGNPTPETKAVYQECIDTALELIEERIDLPAYAQYPARARMAVLMQAARLAKRSTSPEGVAGFGDFGVVRVTDLDPDVEALIERLLKTPSVG